MVLAFIGSLVQNLQNDRDNRALRDKATEQDYRMSLMTPL